MISNSPSRRCAAFSLTDLLVVMVVIAAMLAIQIPTDAASRRTARRMQNSTQLRGIHQGLVTFANSNRNNFAGLDSRGSILADNDRNTGSSGTGNYVQSRYWIMLRGEFFTPEYAISPSEVAEIREYDPGDDRVAAPVQWNDRTKHYSYAMLGFRAQAGAGDGRGGLAVNPNDAGRYSEWKQTLNSQAIVLSDRNMGSNATDKCFSIHSDDDWRGSVLWNDNHVGFENSQYFETKYANGRLNLDPEDNLFDDKQADDEQAKGVNALMVVADDNIVHGEE